MSGEILAGLGIPLTLSSSKGERNARVLPAGGRSGRC